MKEWKNKGKEDTGKDNSVATQSVLTSTDLFSPGPLSHGPIVPRSPMLLIDGYNLLNATGVEPVAHGPTPLHRARQGLLNYLGNVLDEKARQRTTLVFDAAGAPPGLPREYKTHEMHVVFARDFPQADALIEEMIESHSAPRSLLVVSSDHRLHRAARRRGAKAIDSEQWLRGLQRPRQHRTPHSRPEKPSIPQSEAEAAYWTAQFKVDRPTG